MIQIRHLSKKYNGKTVLKNISLNIEKGMSTACLLYTSDAADE